MNQIYTYTLEDKDGNNCSLKDLKGKVLLIVNTATQCGFTSQYQDLQALYDKYKDLGLEIIDIPCNQFAGQTPQSDEEISNFCSLNYKTTFKRFKKSDVNGENELPLYTFLKAEKKFKGFGEGKIAQRMDEMLQKIDKDYKSKSDIKWNFTKFLVSKDGQVLERFEPNEAMELIEESIKSAL